MAALRYAERQTKGFQEKDENDKKPILLSYFVILCTYYSNNIQQYTTDQ